MSSCSSCPSGASCSHSTTHGGDGNCNDQFALQDKRIAQTLGGIRHKIFVMSGKGGVGKSSVTVNTAAALASRGHKVGILDVDMHGPSVPNLLGLKGSVEIDAATGLMLPAVCNDNLSVISMDSLLEDRDQAILWRGPKKSSAIRQFLADVKWGALDYLLIDSPPGTGDEHMTVLKSIPDAQCVVVTTPQEISLADVRKAINFLQYADAAILGMVENMSGLVCPNCGTEIDLFKKGGGRELAKSCGIPFLGSIPLDPATVVAADRGVPVVNLDGDCPAKAACLTLADAIAEACDGSLEGLSAPAARK
ncbi:Mrp/NBP35 family ATP-binding protein [uncultured Desulfovibrio sp.]|uniref:Mrp/NBP35 family ATP-binding protein n=1 Tax=uncultured Desulfovibrio sp. TaxID=167968 RepID=UPI002607AF24|nr:Mrp/NBP35 family ATP-binding protein [uncultured Desulfovibrio sp.]